ADPPSADSTAVQVILREESAVARMPDLSEVAVQWVSDKARARLGCRPLEGRRVVDELPSKPRRLVANVEPLLHAAPGDSEGQGCRHRGPTGEGIHGIAEILKGQIGHGE